MKLDAAIAKLRRAGADAARARIADGRTYNTFAISGYGPLQLALAMLVGVGLAVLISTEK